MDNNFLPFIKSESIPGDLLNQYIVSNCDRDTVLRVKAVDKAVEVIINNRIKQSSVEEFQKHFESIYNFINNPK